MNENDMYPKDVTAEELAAGFRLTSVPNPKANLAGRTPTITAVVFDHSPSHRIVKMLWPDGRIKYELEAFGRYITPFTMNKPPEWLQISGCAVPDPAWVVEYLLSKIGETRADRHIQLADALP